MKKLTKLIVLSSLLMGLTSCELVIPTFSQNTSEVASETSQEASQYSSEEASQNQSEEITQTSSEQGGSSSSHSQTESGLEALTIAEFLRRKDTNTEYQITGVIDDWYYKTEKDLDNAWTYGNFYLKDSTGEILIYGLLEKKGATNKKWFSETEFDIDDTLTIGGTYKEFKGTPEIESAYLISYEFADIGGGEGGGTSFDEPYPDTIITNEGKGLPTGTDGLYQVDFTKAKTFKDVHDLSDYVDGCPTVGDVNVLVLPILFKQTSAPENGLAKLDLALNAETTEGLDYYSAHQYYDIASNHQLNLHYDVPDTWYQLDMTLKDYEAKYNGEYDDIPSEIIEDILYRLDAQNVDLSKYDSDNNGSIDAIVLVPNVTVNKDNINQWAYRYWDVLYDEESGDPYYHGVNKDLWANDYLYCPYGFLEYEMPDGDYNDTCTLIHEFGHVLGADDYYNYAEYGEAPLDDIDVMGAYMMDHSAYTKFYYGWNTTTSLVVANGDITLDLEAFEDTDKVYLFANNFDEDLGVFQEYYIVSYYTKTSLNQFNGFGKDEYPFTEDKGILVYHVDASLYTYVNQGETYTNVYNNNTSENSDDYPYTYYNLIEFVNSTSGNTLLQVGDKTSSDLVDNLGNKVRYVVEVNSLGETSANITFKINA